MKSLLITNGEMVTVTENQKCTNGQFQAEVIYSDGSKGWEFMSDLIKTKHGELK